MPLPAGWKRRAGSAGILPAGLHIVLPNEPEWEKAARGGIELPAQAHVRPFKDLVVPTPALIPNPQPKRAYPWGEKGSRSWPNYDDTKIGSTSTVGAFAAGASPYGVEELSGNVFEWTRSLYNGEVGNSQFRFPDRIDDGREDLRAGTGAGRVVRGGVFRAVYEHHMRCAARAEHRPGLRPHVYRVSGSAVPILHFWTLKTPAL